MSNKKIITSCVKSIAKENDLTATEVINILREVGVGHYFSPELIETILTVPDLKAFFEKHDIYVPSKYDKPAMIELVRKYSVGEELPRNPKNVKPKKTAPVKEDSREIEIPQNEELLHEYETNPAKLDLNKYDFTDVLRFGTISPETDKFIYDRIGYHGLPLREGYSLFKHQRVALEFMRKRESTTHHGVHGGIISLKMGMGKSLTAASHILTSPKGEYPTLIIGSKTVVPEWGRECFSKFFGIKGKKSPKVLYLHRDYINEMYYKSLSAEEFKEYDVVITTYDVVFNTYKSDSKNIDRDIITFGDEHTLMKGKIEYISERTLPQLRLNGRGKDVKGPLALFYTPWHRIVCDESQRFANLKSKTYISIMGLYGRYKWCLTGTPIRNYNTDIFAQYRFIGFDKIQRTIVWRRHGEEYNKKYELSAKVILAMDYTAEGVKQLPHRHEHRVTIPFKSTLEQLYYNALNQDVKNAFKDFLRGFIAFSAVLVKILRLRQACVSPYITRKSEQYKEILKENPDRAHEFKTIDGPGGYGSTKISAVIDILRKIPQGEKFLVFSTFVETLDLVDRAIRHHLPHLQVSIVDGTVTGEDRTNAIEAFKNVYNGMLITYKVGSEGLNLTQANHCIFVEPWWNDAVHNQARARVYRTGQLKETHIYSLELEDTFEQRVYEICHNKNVMADSFLEDAPGTTKNEGLTKENIRNVFGF